MLPNNTKTIITLCVAVAAALSSVSAWAIVGIHIDDLNAVPHPPNPVRIWGKVISVSPLKITDGKGIVEVTGKTASMGEYLVLDGSWNGSILSVSNPAAYEGEMIEIPAGSFLMGNNGSEPYSFSFELPQHSVYLSAYHIGKYEVTRGEYKRFIAAGGYSKSQYWSSEGWSWKGSRTEPSFWAASQNFGTGIFTQTDNHPVVGVSYYEAEAFCNWAGGHLPTEAQWERAARWNPATSHPNVYPWGDTWNKYYCNNYFDSLYSGNQTSPAGSYSGYGSPSGCQDMAGNVWEWCQDWYGNSYYSEVPNGGWNNPTGPSSGASRVLRGGSYQSYDYYSRCAYRSFNQPGISSNSNGFRMAR